MPEYRQYPDHDPRGRHARERAQGAPREGAGAQPRYDQAAYRPAPPGQQSRQHPQQRQGAPSQRAPYRQQQGAYPSAGAAQPAAYRPATTARGRAGGAGGSGFPPSGPTGAGFPSGGPVKKKGGAWRVVFWVALVVFALSLAALGVIGFGYWQGQRTYSEVAEQGFTPPSDIEGTSLADLAVDWDALKAINPDTVGWIYIPGTTVNYPIVHTTDDVKYLKTDFQGETNWVVSFGAIFLAAENAGGFTDANNIVYGHHMNDGSMFSDIVKFEDEGVFNANRTVYILTPQGNYQLKTFSLVHCAADDPLAQTAFASEEERAAYVQDKLDRSVVGASDVPAAADMKQTFTFATCDNLPTDGRWVLFAYVADSTVGTGGAGEASGGLADPNAALAVDDATKEIAS